MIDQIKNYLKSSQRYIQSFNRIAAPFTLMLKMTESSELALSVLRADKNKVVSSNDKTNETVQSTHYPGFSKIAVLLTNTQDK